MSLLVLFVPFRSAVNWRAAVLVAVNNHAVILKIQLNSRLYLVSRPVTRHRHATRPPAMPPADAPFTPAPRLQPSLQLAVAERGCVRAVFISVHGESMFPAARGTGAYVCLETFQREGRGAKRTRTWLAVCQRSLPTSVPVRRTPAADASARSRNRDSTLPRISSRSSHCCQSTPEL